MVSVSGGMLSALARDEMHQPKDTDILACIKGKDKKYIYQQAAIKIQAFARAFLCRRVYLKTRMLIYYSNKIKNRWKLYKLYK